MDKVFEELMSYSVRWADYAVYRSTKGSLDEDTRNFIVDQIKNSPFWFHSMEHRDRSLNDYRGGYKVETFGYDDINEKVLYDYCFMSPVVDMRDEQFYNQEYETREIMWREAQKETLLLSNKLPVEMLFEIVSFI